MIPYKKRYVVSCSSIWFQPMYFAMISARPLHSVMDVEDGLWVSNLSTASCGVDVAEERCGDPMCTDLFMYIQYIHVFVSALLR